MPAPYSYEYLYSSYRNEWGRQKKKNIDYTGTDEINTVDNNTIDIDIDENENESVSDLKWITVAKTSSSSNENEAENEHETYLLACTGSGKVVVWKLGQTTTRTTDCSNPTTHAEQNAARDGPTNVLLVPHARWKISECDDDRENHDDDCDDDHKINTSTDGKALCEMRIVSAIIHHDTANDDATSSTKGRKRQRREEKENESQVVEKGEQQQLLIVAGEDGLWSIPLSEILLEQQQQADSTPSVVSPPSLLRLSDRRISRLQSSPPSSRKIGLNWLFALEKHTNNLLLWDLGRILRGHNDNNHGTSNGNGNGQIGTPEKEIDLSRCFSDKPPPKSRKQRRRLRQKSSVGITRGECATTMLVSKSGDNQLNLLVGTDRSKLWILTIPNGGERDSDDPTWIGKEAPRFFSLNEGGKSSREISPNVASTNKQNIRKKSIGIHSLAATSAATNNNNNQSVWKVTDIIGTNDGTWWTASAVRSGDIGSNNHHHNQSSANIFTAGLLVTWHAPSGMVTARRETREAIHAIRQEQHHHCYSSSSLLYSAGNEAAVSTWDSSFSLERTGRFWASPPSSKAIDIATGTTTMAIAGVGNRVDLFLDRCRVQTLRV